jgi:hypothetical protein
MRLRLVAAALLFVAVGCNNRPKSKALPLAGPALSSVSFPPSSPPKESKALAGGGRWQLVHQGKQPGPQPPQRMQAHVTVWDASGRKVFTSMPNPDGVNVDLETLSPALREVVRLIGIGGTARLWLPPEASEEWRPRAFPNSDLIYEVQVIREARASAVSVAQAPVVPATVVSPPDLAGPPKDARRTATGLAYVIETPGSGTAPGATSRAQLALNAWAQRGLTAAQVIHEQKIVITPAKAPLGIGAVLTQLGTAGTARLWVSAEQATALFPQRFNEALIVDVTLLNVESN